MFSAKRTFAMKREGSEDRDDDMERKKKIVQQMLGQQQHMMAKKDRGLTDSALIVFFWGSRLGVLNAYFSLESFP